MKTFSLFFKISFMLWATVFLLPDKNLYAQTNPLRPPGSPQTKFEISSLAHLRWLSEGDDSSDSINRKRWHWHYVLTADIDASDTKNWNVADHDNDDDTPDVAMGFYPIGHYHSKPTRFQGSFDGQGHTISNLYIYHQKSSGYYAGLFGSVQTDYYIKNVILSNIDFTCDSGGALAHNVHKGTINNCHSSGEIKSQGSIGGLIGSTSIVNNCSVAISDCSSSCTVTGLLKAGYIGGLIGDAFAFGTWGEYLSIKNCSASGNVKSGGNCTGGLIGSASDSILISNCFATGDVTGKSSDLGGLIGRCGGKGSEIKTAKVVNCYSTGNIFVTDDTEDNSSLGTIGGFIGLLGDNVLIDNCHTTADTISTNFASYVGGFIGNYGANGGHSLIRDSYTKIKFVSGERYIGGFIGDGAGAGTSKLSIENCYTKSNVYASDTTNTQVGGFAGYSPDILLNCVAYGNVESPGNNVGGFIGSGHADRIESCYSYGKSVTGNNYVGGFFGKDQTDTLINSHTMAKKVIGNQYVGGFFGSSSTDYNYGCTTHANVEATGDYVGGYAGRLTSWNSNQLVRCYAKGNVQSSGEKYTGGFAGNAGSIIKECYATGDVKGNQYVGGLCGYSENIIECFATGNVTGTKYVGGLCGRGYGIENSFASGNVTTDSYGGSIGSESTVLTSYGTGSVNGTGDYIGGGFAKGRSGTKKCYFDATANPSLQGNGDGRYPEECTGLATAQFANASNFETWDFGSIWQIETIPEIDFYLRPYHQWFVGNTAQTSPFTNVSIEQQLAPAIVTPQQNTIRVYMPFNGNLSQCTLSFVIGNDYVLVVNDSVYANGTITDCDLTAPLIVYFYPKTQKSANVDGGETDETAEMWVVEAENAYHKVSFAGSTGGVVLGDTLQFVANDSTTAPVLAQALGGYSFEGWFDGSGQKISTDSLLLLQGVSENLNITCKFKLSTGIDQTDAVEFNCFPNPCRNSVTIRFEEPYSGAVEFFNVLGQRVKSKVMDAEMQKNIDVSAFPQGIYLIKTGQGIRKMRKL